LIKAIDENIYSKPLVKASGHTAQVGKKIDKAEIAIATM
jgi:hypothetical protein